MDFSFTEEQEMLRKTARDFFTKEFPKTLVRQMEADPTGFRPDIWREMAALGWTGLVIPNEYDGSGGSFMELLVLMEEMGRACLIAPFFSTVICLSAFIDSGTEEQKRRFLTKIAGGELKITLAITEPSASYQAIGIKTKAVANKGGYIINGTKLFVHDAQVADYFLCLTRTANSSPADEGITIFLVDSKNPGIKILPIPTTADDKQNEVVFKDVMVSEENMLGELNRGWPIANSIIERAAVAKCAEMIGCLDWILENCVAYAKERVAFGKPIGTFQALQHYMAEMYTEIGHAKRLVYYAGWLIDQGLPCSREVGMAKAFTNDVYKHQSRMGVQIFGGIGTTRDHDVGLYFRRARQSAPLFGDSFFWREKIAQEIGL